MTKIPAIIVDLDGTLCNMSHRFDLFKDGDMIEFQRKMKDDTPNYAVAELIQLRRIKMDTPVFVTGRRECYRSITTDWFRKYFPGFEQYPLFMREMDDKRDDYMLKREIYFSSIKPFYNVTLVIEDRSNVVKMWRELGLECWQVANGDY